MSEKLKSVLDKLAREHPEVKSDIRDLELAIDLLKDHVERCEYKGLILDIAFFADAWRAVRSRIPPLEREEPISAVRQFYDEIVELLRTRCGCR
jgi:hypothetical protein